MRETHILANKNVGLYTWRGGGGDLKKCTVCTLMKMLTFLDGPLTIIKSAHHSAQTSTH